MYLKKNAWDNQCQILKKNKNIDFDGVKPEFFNAKPLRGNDAMKKASPKCLRGREHNFSTFRRASVGGDLAHSSDKAWTMSAWLCCLFGTKRGCSWTAIDAVPKPMEGLNRGPEHTSPKVINSWKSVWNALFWDSEMFLNKENPAPKFKSVWLCLAWSLSNGKLCFRN